MSTIQTSQTDSAKGTANNGPRYGIVVPVTGTSMWNWDKTDHRINSWATIALAEAALKAKGYTLNYFNPSERRKSAYVADCTLALGTPPPPLPEPVVAVDLSCPHGLGGPGLPGSCTACVRVWNARYLVLLNARNCKTVEEFEAAGVSFPVPFDRSPESPTSEYWLRIRMGLPTQAPRYRVGDWAYNYLTNENQKVVMVRWDSGMHRWLASLPGLTAGDWDLSAAYESAPRVEYVETAPGSMCWRRAESVVTQEAR